MAAVIAAHHKLIQFGGEFRSCKRFGRPTPGSCLFHNEVSI